MLLGTPVFPEKASEELAVVHGLPKSEQALVVTAERNEAEDTMLCVRAW
jgi:hypothetical protein